MKSREYLARMKTISNKDFEKKFKEIEKDMDKEVTNLLKGGK
jgi:hypothetical protein